MSSIYAQSQFIFDCEKIAETSIILPSNAHNIFLQPLIGNDLTITISCTTKLNLYM